MGRTACTESQCLYKGALYLLLYCTKICKRYNMYTLLIHVQCVWAVSSYTLVKHPIKPQNSLYSTGYKIGKITGI